MDELVDVSLDGSKMKDALKEMREFQFYYSATASLLQVFFSSQVVLNVCLWLLIIIILLPLNYCTGAWYGALLTVVCFARY